jgi:hypothetical protein
MSESNPSAIVRAQAGKEAIEHDLLGRAALTDQGPDEMGQGQFAAAREGAGEGRKPCGLAEGVAVDVLAQIGQQVGKGCAVKCKG